MSTLGPTLTDLAGSVRGLLVQAAGEQAISAALEVDYDSLPPRAPH